MFTIYRGRQLYVLKVVVQQLVTFCKLENLIVWTYFKQLGAEKLQVFLKNISFLQIIHDGKIVFYDS